MNELVYLVPLFPLLGFLINGLCRKQLSKSLTGIIGSGSILVSFVISTILFWQVKSNGALPVDPLFTFIDAGSFKIDFAFQVDQLSCLFLLIITGVGFLIHVYSTSYMHDEEAPHFARYFSYLNLFVFSMLLLVLGANFVIMFIGWEGVGLCSYLLIGFWFKNDNYNYAAKKAFVMNRIGDLGFLLAIFWIIEKFHSADYAIVFANPQGTLSPADITGITLLLFVGATGKSAQIPLYTWLPDAMAGPTPVSALIHAATMVTAGIYMIARSNILYTLAPSVQAVVAVIGLATAVFAATIALKQNDIKKVLAYSTVSQLGYMFLGLGVGAYTGAVFHVMTHAFFKACLFLGAGSVIHAMGGEQDMRNMGGLKKYMPVTQITFLLSCFAIAGVPPFSGFFSKDAILSAAMQSNMLYYVIGVLGALLTAFYMFRLYGMTFLGSFRGTHDQEHHLHESPKAITIPLVVLAALATVGGLLGIPEVFVKDSNWLEKFLAPVFAGSTALTQAKPAEGNSSMELVYMFVVAAIIVAVIAFAWSKYKKYEKTTEPETGLGKVLANKWYVDEIYDAIVVRPLNALAGFLKNVVEKSGIDGFVNGVGRFVQYSSRQLRLLQSGLAGNYILYMVLSIVVLFVIFWNQTQIVQFLENIF
ncbi:MAG TPA: NADH-quinone oxidoreductase subunit L [Chitinophagaceae bacterium]|nr:NADH-quinone oxidoreductase subunit L [Chitinophagaceae bacterium]